MAFILVIGILFIKFVENGNVLGIGYTHSSGVYPVISNSHVSIEKNSANSFNYFLTLNANPGEEVLVGVLTRANSNSFFVDPELKSKEKVLKFNETNWNLPQEVTIYIDSNVKKGKYVITNILNSEANVEVNITTAGIVFNPTYLESNYKENSSSSYSLKLSQNPHGNFEVQLDTSNLRDIYFDEARTIQKVKIQFNKKTWDVPQFIKLFYSMDTLPGNKNIKHSTSENEIYFYSLNINYLKPVFNIDSEFINPEFLEYTYSFRLDSEPLEDTQVEVRTSQNSKVFLDFEKSLTSKQIQFSKSDWYIEKEIKLFYSELNIGDTFRIEHEILGQKYLKQFIIDGFYPVISQDKFISTNGDLSEITYNVKLNKQPQSEERVVIQPNSAYFNIENGQNDGTKILTFNSTNWNEPQDVKIFVPQSIPYGSYDVSNSVMNSNEKLFTASQKVVSLSVTGSKLIFNSGKTFSNDLESGFIDISFRLDSDPVNEARVLITKSNPDDAIFFNSNLNQQTSFEILNSENWNQLRTFRVYLDKQKIQPFNYYEIEMDLNGVMETIKLYPYL